MLEPIIYTYFVQDESGNIKIGKSINPKSRLIEFQVGNASKLTLLFYDFGDREKKLHKKFNFFRIRNSEWFRPNEKLTQLINSRIEGFDIIKKKKRFHDLKIMEEKNAHKEIKKIKESLFF